MNKSEEIGQLALALSKLQGEIKDGHNDTQGYGYKYVKLQNLFDIARPLLAKYQLSIMQMPGLIGDTVKVDTILMHESGQWVSSTIEMPFEKIGKMSGAQSTGAIITYAKRYSLMAFLGFCGTDDDTDAAEPVKESYPKPITSAQYKELMSLIEETGTDLNKILNHFKTDDLSELNEREYITIKGKLSQSKESK